MNLESKSLNRLEILKSNVQSMRLVIFSSLLMVLGTSPVLAHCDSYDGPVINDATKALETNNVDLVLKWITQEQEPEIIPLFNKTNGLKSGDKEVYAIVEKHFLETLVRLHRETEGAAYTGLKPAGTTKQIIQMTDRALQEENVDDFLLKLNSHIDKVVREKYQKAADLNKVKNNSIEEGRAFVEAYVDYTHSVEAIDDILQHGGGHSGH